MSIEKSVGKQWEEVLKDGGYESPPLTPLRFKLIYRYSRTWKKIHELIPVRAESTFFEFGCGGGKHLVPLALHGHQVTGIDVSSAVLERCRTFVTEVERYIESPLPIKLHQGDFLEHRSDNQYDVVFNVGVIEHFINNQERFAALTKMYSLTKAGGFVISIVPNGIHPLRKRQRAEGLGGYHVPEIDYHKELALNELKQLGATECKVIPINLFWYLTMLPRKNHLAATLRKGLYLIAQLIPKLPSTIAYRHAGSLIILGRKPYSN